MSDTVPSHQLNLRKPYVKLVAIGGDISESRDDLLAVIREIYPPEKEKLAMTD